MTPASGKGDGTLALQRGRAGAPVARTDRAGVATLASVARVTVRAVERGARRCALCHDDLPLLAARPCPDCRTETHADCREEAGHCPSIGCPRARAPRKLPAPAPGVATGDPAPLPFGAVAGVAATLVGLAAGFVTTGGRAGLPLLIVVALAVSFSAVGTFVAVVSRAVEQLVHGERPARVDTLWNLPLVLAALAGAGLVGHLVHLQALFDGELF